VIVAGGMAVGGLSGGCFNPAVALSIDLGGLFGSSGVKYGYSWAYAAAELLAAAVAAAIFSIVGMEERSDDDGDEDEDQESMLAGRDME